MYKELAIREFAVLLPLFAAQVGIAFALLKWSRGRRALRNICIAFIAAEAIVCLSVLSANIWMAGVTAPSFLYRWNLHVATPGGIWLFMTAPTYVIFMIYRWIEGRVPPETSPERRKLLQTAGTLAIASPFGVMAFGIMVERFDFYIREIDMPVANLHPDLEGLRILQISDVHLGTFLSEKQFARAIDMCQGLHPHLAVMTGDLISSFDDPVDGCLRQLSRIKSDAGMLGCMGNHEIYAGVEAQVKREAAKFGISFLRHEQRELQFGAAKLNVAGVDYQRGSAKKDYLAGAENLIVPGRANLLLSHNPDVFPVAAKQGWDLTLAGHTHGGQITLEIVEQTVNIARFHTPYVAGAYRIGDAGCYVTRGIGTVALPARLGCPPEITLLRLKRA